jgi:peptidoglycan LD-endopeptidase CwlK
MNMDQMIRAVQKRLGVDVDGAAGPDTWQAIYQSIVGEESVKKIKQKPVDHAAAGKKADSRSEKNIATLHPRVRPCARALIEKAAMQGIIIKVISGTRSYEEQAELYRKYKEEHGPLAAAPGRSNHNFGIAFDIGIFTGSSDPEKAKNYIPESPAYKAVGALARNIGLFWGGNWKNADEPHYELRPSWADDLDEKHMIDQLASRKHQGTDPFA